MATPSIDPGTAPPGGFPPAGLVITEHTAAIRKRSRCVFSSAACAVSLSARQRIKTYVLLTLMLVFGTAGNIFLDKGMKRIGPLELSNSQALLNGAARVLMSGTVWLGIALMLGYMVSYMLVLSWADYSFVMPFTALSYAMVAVTGYIWLGEKVPGPRWFGIGLIVAGVFLVSRTPTTTTTLADASSRVAVPDVARAAAFASATINPIDDPNSDLSSAKSVGANGNASARAAAGGR
jgi:multidrug transporter EmrE-like cation transporter